MIKREIYPKENRTPIEGIDYNTNDSDIISEFTKELGDEFVAELVADRSFLDKRED